VIFAEPYALFFSLSISLLIVEVVLGMTFGVALSGAIAFFILGILSLLKVLSGLNHYLIAGSIIFAVSNFAVLVLFRRISPKKPDTQDVNDY